MTDETIGKRIGKLVEHFGLTKNSFSKEIGLTSNTIITRAVNKDSGGPSYPIIERIANRWPEVNMRWLITGKGVMLDQPGSVINTFIKYYQTTNPVEVAKALRGEAEPTSVLFIYGFEDCDCAFDVVGDGMAPRYIPGEIILCHDARDLVLVPGNAYLVVTEHQQFIRYLYEVTPEGDFIFSAENDAYKNIKVEKHQLQHLYYIKGRIRRDGY